MLRDARIRLEGRLEELERAVTSLRRAIAGARGGDFVPLGAAMRLTVDEAQLARVARDEPEVEKLQRTWAGLRAKAEKVVRARAREMRIPEEGALDTLLAEPVRYEGVARHPLAWLGPMGIALFVALEVIVVRHPAPLIMHGSIGVILTLAVWFAPRLRVTSRRVFIGREVVEVSEVKSVEIEQLMSRSRRYRLKATLHSGAQRMVRLPAVPEDFVFALRFRARIPVTRTGWWGWL